MIASEREIDLCQFHNWYDIFRGVSVKSRVVPLPEEFFNYLTEDGVFAPLPSHLDHDHLSDEEDVETKSNEYEARTQYRFDEVEAAIQDALLSYDKQVFVKTNWSAPLDAAWMNAGSMKCSSVNEVFLLVKSSDRVTFDAERMYELLPEGSKKRPDKLYLIIRKWANLHPSMEFRAFIYNRKLIGICQRNCTTFFPFLSLDAFANQELICNFYTKEIAGKATLDSYTMDLYIDQKKRVWLVDLNPFGQPTCPLLFEWEELAGLEELEMRVVESEGEVLQSTAGTSRGPIDVHLAEDFPRFLEICKQQQQEQKDEEKT